MDDILKKLLEAKLNQNKIIDVEKPVFTTSNDKYIRLRKIGTPDKEPIDYSSLNNPNLVNRQFEPIEDKEIKKDNDQSFDSKDNKIKAISQVSQKYTAPTKPIEPLAENEELNFANGVPGIIKVLSERIPDHEKEAYFDDVMENGDLSDEEKVQLTDWAKEDAKRIKNQNNKF